MNSKDCLDIYIVKKLVFRLEMIDQRQINVNSILIDQSLVGDVIGCRVNP